MFTKLARFRFQIWPIIGDEGKHFEREKISQEPSRDPLMGEGPLKWTPIDLSPFPWSWTYSGASRGL